MNAFRVLILAIALVATVALVSIAWSLSIIASPPT